jgi:hypothetical protein
MKGEANNLETSSHTGLQIQEDFALQAREWKVQRTAWLLFGVVVLAGVLGIFGRGLLSGASVTDGDLDVRYQRFERLQHPPRSNFKLVPTRKKPPGSSSTGPIWMPFGLKASRHNPRKLWRILVDRFTILPPPGRQWL